MPVISSGSSASTSSQIGESAWAQVARFANEAPPDSRECAARQGSTPEMAVQRAGSLHAGDAGPPQPPWLQAVHKLMHPAAAGTSAHGVVEDFSRQTGCLSDALSHPDATVAVSHQAARQRQYRLTQVYRYWGNPLVSSALQNPSLRAQPLRDVLPCGEDALHLGGVAIAIAEPFHRQSEAASSRSMRQQERSCAARLYSRFGGFSPAGAWHAMLAELSQDLYLKNLLQALPRHETVDLAKKSVEWPTLSGPSLMTLEHGVGVPVMQINWTRTAIGFSDVVDESLLSIEGRLFSNWLLLQSGGGAGNAEPWPQAQIEHVLTPALAAWVSDMQREGVGGGTALWASWFQFLTRQSAGFGHAAAFSSGVSDHGDVLRTLKAEFDHIRFLVDEDLLATDLECWQEACPAWCGMVQGLVILQDAVIHGGGGLPVAGHERLYLASLLRNMTCAALSLHEAAEVAQFDLLLQACRKRRNTGFAGQHANQALERHHVWVAESQPGYRTLERKALKQLTTAYSQAAEQGEHECIFSLDEACPTPARFCA